MFFFKLVVGELTSLRVIQSATWLTASSFDGELSCERGAPHPPLSLRTGAPLTFKFVPAPLATWLLNISDSDFSA